jgi:flagellar hook assembly protein FlgD
VDKEKLMINLYDSKGSLVKKISTGDREAGIHQFSFNGTGMNNGIYFCEISAGKERTVRKIILQK